jgi:hypothetical protein
MRKTLCISFFLLCSDMGYAQEKVSLFDGQTTSGWEIEGNAEVKDGVLVLGGNQKTRARIASDFSSEYELHLEYSTENNKPIQFESHERYFLGRGMWGMSLYRTSSKPGEWIEAIYLRKDKPVKNGWSTVCKWRVVGEPAFTEQEVGGSADAPRSTFVAFEIPAGQKLYLRKVRVTQAAASFPWILGLTAGALLVALLVILARWAILKKRRTAAQSTVPQEQ